MFDLSHYNDWDTVIRKDPAFDVNLETCGSLGIGSL